MDSSVCAALLHAALPTEQIHCLHVDHGFMRKDESEGVIKALEAIGLKVVRADGELQEPIPMLLVVSSLSFDS